MFVPLWLLMLFCNSCINDAEEFPPVVPEEKIDDVYIRFSVLTKNELSTRAADIEGDIVGSGVENRLNISDIKYLIYDNNLKFLQDITPYATTVAANDEYSVYDVVAKIDNKYFLDNINGIITFNILVLANYSGWGVKFPDQIAGEGIESMFKDGLQMNVLPNAGIFFDPDLYPEEFYPDGRYFPMAGLQQYSIVGSMLTTSGEESPYDLSYATGKDVNLLRALAKIEVVDKINVGEDESFDEETDNKGEASAVRISKVDLYGYFKSGKILPDISQWRRYSVFETQQVVSPTTTGSVEYSVPETLFKNLGIDVVADGNSISFYTDNYARSKRKDNCPVYSCYVFEYSNLNIAADALPYMVINTKGYWASMDVSYDSMNFALSFADFNDETISPSVNKLRHLLRNHIYRFEIVGVGQNLSVNWTVCEMDQASSDIEFN